MTGNVSPPKDILDQSGVKLEIFEGIGSLVSALGPLISMDLIVIVSLVCLLFC